MKSFSSLVLGFAATVLAANAGALAYANDRLGAVAWMVAAGICSATAAFNGTARK